MKAFILALATAVPQYSAQQSEIAKKIIDTFGLKQDSAQYVQNLYNRTEIKRRFSVLPEIEKEDDEAIFFNNKNLNNFASTHTRNELYIKHAPELALKAAKDVINNWSEDAKKITHIISVSCTGVMAPGIEFLIQQKLNLNDDVQRIGLNFMGCFGAFRALALANSIAMQDSNNRILIVCTELCSLHFQICNVPEILIGNALFADGSAAAIIGQPENNEKKLWSIEKVGSYAIKDSQDQMTWKISDHGCVMYLSKQVPSIIEQNSKKILENFLGSNNFSDYIWAIHPGGKSIVKALENCCNLNNNQTVASWEVLKKYGNMSSATFLFVLKELEHMQDKKIIGIGFGPGLSIETILLN